VDLTTVKDVSIIVGGVATLAGFMAALSEYARQNHARRAEHFAALRRRFLETPSFQPILASLADDHPRLAEVPLQDRRNFLGFFEEIQLMVDSRLVKPEVAHIMFGRYVRMADDSRHLWAGLEKGDRYWAIFRRMAADTQRREALPTPAKPLRF
jgi:hypothetical protein